MRAWPAWPVQAQRDPAAFVSLACFADHLREQLLAVYRRLAASAEDDHRLRAKLLERHMFVCDAGHPSNHYTRTGLPRTHAGWEMQLLVDDGLLYYLYERSVSALLSADALQLHEAIEQLCAGLCCDDWPTLREALRAHYGRTIVAFMTKRRAFRPAGRELLEVYTECVILDAYLRLAVAAPGATLTFDLFPAHTGDDNVREGLKGLVNIGDISHRGARKFYCCRAETYTRYYGRNLARALGSADTPRLGLVVPYANSVRHIALTRCWPLDGAETLARQVEAVHAAWLEHCERTGAAPVQTASAPTILVSGYSQGGAVVRLFDDALAGIDVIARAHFRASAPRWYGPRARTLARIIEGAWAGRRAPTLHTVSLATMGGIDGRPQADDARGAAGIRSHTNGHGGLHLGICHEHDPARFIVPGPLLPRRGARRQRGELGIVQILRRFGGPGQALHGGTWTSGAHQAFAQNPAAMRLLDEVDRLRLSSRFVDEADYVDPRCRGQAFTHLVVGTYGYPGWTVVETFVEALGRLGHAEDSPRASLLHEPSWGRDILPDEIDHAAMAAMSATAAGQGTGRLHLLRRAR